MSASTAKLKCIEAARAVARAYITQTSAGTTENAGAMAQTSAKTTAEGNNVNAQQIANSIIGKDCSVSIQKQSGLVYVTVETNVFQGAFGVFPIKVQGSATGYLEDTGNST
jgi:hypothetical protein